MVSCSTTTALDLLVFVFVSLATVTITTGGRHVASALVNNVAAPSPPRRSRSTGTGQTGRTRANPLIQDFFATLEEEDAEDENDNTKGGKSIQLNIGIDVRGRSDAATPASRLAINGLAIELLNEDADSKRPLMPGSNGPTPQLSGGNGPRALKVLNEGFFVNMKGMQTIPLRNGCWEMNWRDGAPAGTLILGFDLEKEVRTGCMLSKSYIGVPTKGTNNNIEQLLLSPQTPFFISCILHKIPKIPMLLNIL